MQINKGENYKYFCQRKHIPLCGRRDCAEAMAEERDRQKRYVNYVNVRAAYTINEKRRV